MRLFSLFDKRKALAEFDRHRLGVIAADIEVTAPLWPIIGEACDDEMTTLRDRMSSQLDILPPVGRIGQEVENRPVMPDIESAEGFGFGDIGSNPLDSAGTLSQPRLGHGQRGLGDIENGDFLEGKVKEPIDEHGGTAPHVDDSPMSGLSDRAD